jgi:sulfonate transport system ATP-binding protein
VVFQDSRLLPWANLLTNVTLGQRKAARARGSEALAEVGLGGREKDWPHQLSGGEQQRVALARSLVREPELLLADEPFGALDALTRLKMHGLLRQLHQAHHPAVLLVTHDVDEAITLADRVVVLDHGRVALERRIDVDDSRDPSGAEFSAVRRELLHALGVRRPHTSSHHHKESA